MSRPCSPGAVYQTILFPARTEDYVVKKGSNGHGLFAARNIRKGEAVFSDSLEFSYADVVDGDDILLSNGVVKRGPKRKYAKRIPARIPSTRDMLLRTHGVDFLRPDPTGKSAGIAVSELEVPGMLMNHSCDPNVINQGWGADSQDIAARDIKKGDELTDNYILHEDDHGMVFDCKCGSANCRGSVNLFEELGDEEKERLLPFVTDVVRAEHEHDAGRGPPVNWEDEPTFPIRVASGVPRLVFPGPSYADAKIAVRQDEEGEFNLYALRDFGSGERIYEFWRQDWPLVGLNGAPIPIDMVLASALGPGDPPEGTVIRLDPFECAAPRDRHGRLQFTGWDMIASHCCEPSMVYNDVDEDEDENWRATYAVRDIKEGEILSVDYNSILWDRTECKSAGACGCGAKKCAGTTKGFMHLPPDAQEERKLMSWKRISPPYGENIRAVVGGALAPHVRVSWRKDAEQRGNAPDTDSSSSSSSDDESESDSGNDSS